MSKTFTVLVPKMTDEELLKIEFEYYMDKRNSSVREIADCKHDSELAIEELAQTDKIFAGLKTRAEKLGVELTRKKS